MFRIFIFVYLTFHLCLCEPLLPSIADKLNKVSFAYPLGAQSERDLFVCPENGACNIIHKRFWLPPLVERLCRCPQRRECTWTWNEQQDNYTMMLDNRSQIKFCSDLSDLPNCTIKKPAIQVVIKDRTASKQNETVNNRKNRSNQKPVKMKSEQRNVTALCQCKEPHYWKQRLNMTKFDSQLKTLNQFYGCSKLKKCDSDEFCGYIRADTHSTYYRCSCPKGHMCISKEKTLFKVEEMLFNGEGYKAFCFKIKI